MHTPNRLVLSSACRQRRVALSLIEVLVVIAIIAVVIGLILPAVQRVRESANRAQCMNNLKQIGLACHTYHETYGALPYTRTKGAETWALLLLPFLEQANTHARWQFGQRYYAPANAETRTSVVNVYLCPTRRSPSQRPQLSLGGDEDRRTRQHVPGALSDYAACAGDPESINDYWWGRRPANGAFWHGTYQRTRRDVQFKDVFDGLSTTLLVGEKHIPFRRFGYAPDSSVFNGDTGASFKKAGLA